MATLQLPTLTDGSPHYSFRTQLDGTDYLLTFRFGERRNGWVLDLATLDGEQIIAGQLVTIGVDLLRRCTSASRPPGTLYAWNVTTQKDADGGVFALPGLYDLGAGGRARLYYREAASG